MNAIQQLFQRKNKNLLSLFFTAGYPDLYSTQGIIDAAQRAGIDFLEVGMPYSDPLADGPVIQQSSSVAIANGMHIGLLMEQLQEFRSRLHIPILLMGYLNPVLQYGFERFLKEAAQCGTSGLILPDLPLEEYEQEYQSLFQENNISPVFLITPQTSEQRIRKIDQLSDAFIYVVSSAAITGQQQDFGAAQQKYFERLMAMELQNPLIGGFGIHNPQTLQLAWKNLHGAICGSAFLKKLAQTPDPAKAIDWLMADLGLA